MLKLTRLFLSMTAIIMIAASLQAEEHIVWQIGTPDGSYDDLAIARNYGAYPARFPEDVTFVIGKDEPATTWPFIQPGPVDVWAGSRKHPFKIVFTLADQPVGIYHLKMALVDTHSTMPPGLEVLVNDQNGRMQLPNGGADGSLNDPSQGKPYNLKIDLPASYLHLGENSITLQLVTGAWLSYDAIELTNDPDADPNPVTVNSLAITPTVCFVRRGSDLKQVVILDVQLSAASQCEATVKYQGHSKSLLLQSGLFGNISTDIEVNEVSGPTPLDVTLTTGGQTQTATCEVRPEKHWKLYIQDSSHVDIGYTDRQEQVKTLHNDNMNLALDLCQKYPDFKWNTETAWVEDNYLSMMPKERTEEFIKLAKEGRIGCQANYGNILTGLCSNESLIRNYYYAHTMARKYGIPFDIATSSDVPTQVWTLPTVLADSGIHYFSAGLNLVRADSFNRLFDKSPFYWQGPDGSKVLTWLAPGYGYVTGLALDSDLKKTRPLVNRFLKAFDRENYPYDAVFAYGGYYDNVRLSTRLPEVVEQWNKTYEYPELIFCRGPEFFRDIESNFRDQIPTITGDGGGYWEDGAGSSAHETALSRCAKEDLVTAEKMLSLASNISGDAYPADRFDEAWKDALLYDEHTWGAAESRIHPETENSKDQWAYKAAFASESAKSATALKAQGIDALARLVKVDEPSVLVFNPNSWDEKGLANLEESGTAPMAFMADVPAMGYRLYPLSVLKHQAEPSALPAYVLENRFYRLELNPQTGGVAHLLDKDLDRELVDASAPYGLNQYLYFLGGGESMREVTHNDGAPQVSLTKEARPGCQTMVIRSSAFNTPTLTKTILLYDGIKRIDFLNTLEKIPTTEYEAGYFAFPFAINNPQFHIALPDGVVNPAENMLDGGCMAWYCTQDFVAVTGENVTVVWTAMDSPLVTLSDVNREVTSGFNYPELKPYTAGKRWPVPLDNGHVFGYLFNNYWFTNYKASQGGQLQFRFALTSMKNYDGTAATRFGQSVRNPLVAKRVEPQAIATGLPALVSLCSVSPQNVCIQTIKRAQSGKGWIVRLREVGGQPVTATLSLPAFGFDRAWQCSLVEDPQSELTVANQSVKVGLKAKGLMTVLLQ